MTSNIIDLDLAEKAVSSVISDQQQQQPQDYQSKTFNANNKARNVYLPIFPTTVDGPNERRLLANIPITHLAPHEINRRRHGATTKDAIMLMNSYKFSKYESFILSEEDANELATRLHVGLSIITFNAHRLDVDCTIFMGLYKLFRRNILRKPDSALKGPVFNSRQMAIVLEFYLQIDVDLFFMKTCSFRGAKPRSLTEGVFCGEDEPKPTYDFTPCDDRFCSCCHPTNTWQGSQSSPIVQFQSNAMHKFINGYTTYLNCPATCKTKNIIYVMTCPCGLYDYVDSTAETLIDAMIYHRNHGNRIIHEKLTGNFLFRAMTRDPNRQQKEIANKMRLYQHSARCPVALRLFLDYNPQYWCFIPLLWHDAQAENIASLQETCSPSSRIVDLEAGAIIARFTTGNSIVNDCHANVPLPPAAYLFSYEQRHKQRLFFEQFLSLPVDQSAYSPVDSYKMTTIAVLPDDCWSMPRYMIETYFIVHGETKLNMICPIGDDPQERYGRPYNLVWCADLNRPFTINSTSTH